MPLLIVLFAVAVIIFIGFGVAAYALFRLALDRHVDKHLVLRNLDHQGAPGDGELTDPYSRASLRHWRETAPREDRYHTAPDGVRLHAAVLRNPAGKNRWAVVLHGYTVQQPLTRFAKHFYDAGYHLLVPTLRGHGESGGRYITMGWLDRLDVVRWVEALTAEQPDARIVLHGVSMGAATALMASGEALPGAVRCVVGDCGYTGVADEFRHQLKRFFRLPAFPVLPMAGRLVKRHLGYDIRDASTLTQLSKSRLPTLLIHGERDSFVPAWMLEPLFEAAPYPKEKLMIAQAGHGAAANADPKRYWDTVWRFIEQHIETQAPLT